MIFECTKHRIGQQYLPALINNDYTGLDDYEELQLAEWLEKVCTSWTDADGHSWAFGHIAMIDNTEDDFALCEVASMRGATIDVLMNFYKEN
jgi:hypothetical protein